jgi:hypothetical protein
MNGSTSNTEGVGSSSVANRKGGVAVANIYLSSTYADLQAHRKAVYDQLRRMQHSVKAMEDYVARDDRPADACVRDVVASNLYVGVFAWRYGYVPKEDNPESLSVTEMEYRAAAKNNIPRLVFLLDDAAAWSPKLLDLHTGEGEKGARIDALRKRLTEDRMASFFTSPEDLAAKVAASVHLASALGDASDASLDLATIVGQDVIDRPEMLFNRSYAPDLARQIADLGNVPLLKINLGNGTHWWSTRLFALATLAQEYTSVEWLLFLEAGSQYVGMVRPRDLRHVLALQQPQLEEMYVQAQAAFPYPNVDPLQRACQILDALVQHFGMLPGGEQGFRFFVDSGWLTRNVPSLSTVRVERAGEFDPLATFQLLDADTPFVPITAGQHLLKVIDRVGVATEIARTVVERRLGRQ